MYKNYGPLAAQVYELTKPVGNMLNGDIDYYCERLQGIKGKILEAGVGTGRMLIPLLQEGYQIEGIDQSHDMLTICQNNLAKYQLQTAIYQGDLATFELLTRYDAIIMPTATFCLIETEELASQALINCYQHLSPGGRLIIDLDLPFYPEAGETETSTYRLSSHKGITLERKVIEIDWLAQHVLTHVRYEEWQDGVLISTELQRLLLRWYGLTELRLILEKVGFESITISADYDYLVPPVDSNQTITFEATKKGID
ncbi:SAM-dependent methyltransferase [Vagococcus penaei]|uniref:SAM-dependent methyltransferase n=1 Tax=Vagococcus penaei TaxID=633807 RepID=A0A1Q2D3B6_9ENTE|nr:class I SAM-dependent methyltransferase [Vagococcus penaei]AQP52869.1 SAM-dependent methyltransferase [Vagococcus penaei]RST97639.1 SAM-dependent methyltransferase [Vagococcus penaei]